MDVKISASQLQILFDTMPDVVFFVKDCAGRYTHVNSTLVMRVGLKRREQVLGRDVTELYPSALAASFASQDRRVLAGNVIENHLEMHTLPSRAPGWCLTCKYPLRAGTEISGLMGFSRDLNKPDRRNPTYSRLIRAMDFLQEHYAENVRVSSVAGLVELSVAQLERHFRRVFQLTPYQVLTKLRIEAAMRLLHGCDSIADIGLACGFTDQSAFARQFKATVKMTPKEYRDLCGTSKS